MEKTSAKGDLVGVLKQRNLPLADLTEPGPGFRIGNPVFDVALANLTGAPLVVESPPGGRSSNRHLPFLICFAPRPNTTTRPSSAACLASYVLVVAQAEHSPLVVKLEIRFGEVVQLIWLGTAAGAIREKWEKGPMAPDVDGPREDTVDVVKRALMLN
jgi:hypothetical protein